MDIKRLIGDVFATAMFQRCAGGPGGPGGPGGRRCGRTHERRGRAGRHPSRQPAIPAGHTNAGGRSGLARD